MTTVSAPIPSPPTTRQTLEDLLAGLGNISPRRIRLHPAPGAATEQDVVAAQTRGDRLCELIDGTLVEKAMGYQEALLAAVLVEAIGAFVRSKNLGLVTGADGAVRLFAGMVRIPDVAFVSWRRIPDRRVPTDPIPALAPDLAIEVLSESNTAGEMKRKRGDYFQAGVRLAWFVEPRDRSVTVYTSPQAFTVLTQADVLDGGDVLPGFSLPVADLFAELDRQGQA